MSIPLFLVPELPSGTTFTLAGPEGRHAETVQRLRVGERLLLGDGRGTVVLAQVTAAGKGTLDLALGQRSSTPAADPRIVVAQALAKGDRGELAVQAMTEVGVDGIVPWAAARSIVHWKGGRAEKSWQRWESTIREATKQARRPWLPDLAPLATTGELVALSRGSAACLVLHEEAAAPLGTVPLPAKGDIVLVVGPEGGVSEDEVKALVAAGAVPIRLGGPVLRTSTAGAAAIAALSVRLARW